MPGPFLARNLPTGVSSPSGASSSTWFSPTSSSTASTPCSCTTSRWARSSWRLSRYSSSAGSISATATPMWSIRANTPRSVFSAPGALVARRGVDDRRHVDDAGGCHDAQPDARRALQARHAGHDPLDRVAFEHLVLEQLVCERVELDAVHVDHPLRRTT